MNDLAITATMTHEEIAFRVCTGFARAGFELILVGGACVEIYAGGGYASLDADFVCQFSGKKDEVKKIMRSRIHANSDTRSVYRHSNPNVTFSIDLLSGPVAIGNSEIQTFATRIDGALTLTMLTAEDCVCDQLAAYRNDKDEPSLRRAEAVVAATRPDLDAIGRWLDKEPIIDRSRDERDRRRLRLAPRKERS